jgi:hypothetical protein
MNIERRELETNNAGITMMIDEKSQQKKKIKMKHQEPKPTDKGQRTKND